MLAALLFASLAEAHDLEIHVQVPGADPVWTTLRDVQPGSTHRVEFLGEGRTDELAQFVMGETVPAADASPDVKVFRGYQISWVVESPRP